MTHEILRGEGHDRGGRLGRLASELRHLARLRVLPPRIASFEWRAWRLASQTGDVFSLVSATRPKDLAVILRRARGSRRVVELGTGTAWTTIALAIGDADSEVITYDPIVRPERERYLALAAPRVRDQITFVSEPGANGPHDETPVDFLYVDSTHDRQATIDELHAWRPVLRPGATVVLDDFTHPEFPGVREAVRELGLLGSEIGTLFVCPV
jgi:Methyltransferase domain